MGGSVVYPDEIYEYTNKAIILHYDHDSTLTSLNDTYHTYNCNGSIYHEPHDYESVNSCYEKCTTCGHTHQKAAHSYNRYATDNSTKHYAYCSCGAVTSLPHNFTESNGYNVCGTCGYSIAVDHVHSYTARYTVALRGSTHYAYCSCGDSVKENCVGFAMVGSTTSTCLKCGQTILSLKTSPLHCDDVVTYSQKEIAILPKKEEEY